MKLNDYSFRELIELQNMVIRCKAYFPENSTKADFWTEEISKALARPTIESHERSNSYDQADELSKSEVTVTLIERITI